MSNNVYAASHNPNDDHHVTHWVVNRPPERRRFISLAHVHFPPNSVYIQLTEPRKTRNLVPGLDEIFRGAVVSVTNIDLFSVAHHYFC